MSLKQKTISGLIWTLANQFGAKLISFVVQIFLARILLPSDFGLIAMIMIFISVGNALSDSGMTSSLIRSPNADNRDYSTVFFINLFASALIYLIVFILAPYIAEFYDEELLTKIIRIFAFSYIIKAFVGVQETILKKELNFKKLMIIQLPSVLIGGVVGITLALNGYGVWSLVWLTISQNFIFSVQLWLYSDWTPSLIIDKGRFTRHFGFGYKLTIASVMNAIFNNIYNIVIGKWYSSTTLGYYNRADSIRLFPVASAITALKSVTYPVLSKIQGDDTRLKDNYQKIMEQVVFFVTPLMVILIIIAEPLFRILLTEKWVPAVPFFQILCFASILYPLQEYNLQILDVKGKSGLYLKIEIVKKIITILAVALAVPYGIYFLLWTQVFLMIAFYIISAFYSGRLINFSIQDQIKNVYPIFLISFFLGTLIYIFDKFVLRESFNIYLKIIVPSLLYTLFYLVFSYFFKIKALAEAKDVLLILNKKRE